MDKRTLNGDLRVLRPKALQLVIVKDNRTRERPKYQTGEINGTDKPKIGSIKHHDVEFRSLFDKLALRRRALMDKMASTTKQILPDAPRRIYLPAMSSTPPRRETPTGGHKIFPTLRARTSHSSKTINEIFPVERVPAFSASIPNGVIPPSAKSHARALQQHGISLMSPMERRHSAPVFTRIASKYISADGKVSDPTKNVSLRDHPILNNHH